MALLDGIFGNSGGGLLDFLRNNAMNQQFHSGLASDQAQYGPAQSMPMQAMAQMPQAQPSPLDTAQWPFGPMGAPSQGGAALPTNAQPTQGQLPVQQPQASPAFGDSYIDRVNAGGGLIRSLFGSSAKQQQQQQLFDAYKNAGLSPSQAYVAVLNPNMASNFIGGGQTDDIKEYNFAKREDPGLTFQKFMQQKKAVSGEYSLTPQYGTNEKGETVLIQTGKSGEAIQTKLPAGVKVSSGVERIDLGTEWGIIDKRTGTLIGRQAKDLQGKEAAEERGKQQGQAQAKIPAALIDAEETTKKIDDLLKNEGLDAIVGSVDQYRPSWALGEGGRKALSQLEQLQGGAFLQAFNTLKGGGAITEIEGQKAERAIARMQRYQSEKDFREALMDFRDAVKTGVRKLQAAANSGAAPAAGSPPSNGASVDDLLKKYGGK